MRSTLVRFATKTLYRGTSRSTVDTTHICVVVILTVMVDNSLCQCHKPDSNWVKNILSLVIPCVLMIVTQLKVYPHSLQNS